LVCATHRDLRAMVLDGTFRQDLFYRVARLIVPVPALRSRPEDVRALCGHFLREIASEVGPRQLSEEALRRLIAHDWPGNARELRNVLCAAATTASSCIELTDIERALSHVSAFSPRGVDVEMLRRTVNAHGGNLAAAARALGMPRSTLRDRLRALQEDDDASAA
jgi:two-component system NtrC family response regulator